MSRRWVYGILITSIAIFYLFLSTFQADKIFNFSRRVMNKDYMNLDGEDTSLPLSCSTCALVGTSGHLLNHEYGSDIDGNDCIFRLGFSRTRGKGNVVGKRTTVRIVDSVSFFPFLKRPTKLVTGPFHSEIWLLFHRRAGDISWFHKPLLWSLTRKHDSKFFWMTKKAEGKLYESLKNETSNKGQTRLTALWYALKVIEDTGCKSLDIYGIPDPQICKRDENVGILSLYWDNSSIPLCLDGVDASFILGRRVPPESSYPTVTERRALLNWKQKHDTNIHFLSPDWPFWLF